MEPLTFAITHQGFSSADIAKLIEEQRVALGWKVKDVPIAELEDRAASEVSHLSTLEAKDCIAVVTYGKKKQRWLCRFVPDCCRRVEAFSDRLWSLKYADRIELPGALVGRGISVGRGKVIRPLVCPERDAVLYATPPKWLN